MSSQKVRMLTVIIDLTENGKKVIDEAELMSFLDKERTLEMSMEDFEMYRMNVLARHSLLSPEMVN